MLLRYSQICKKPRIFSKLTGHSLEQFSSLCRKLKPLHDKHFPTIGRKRVLYSIEEKVLALLIYYRTYISYEFLGYCLGLDQSNICRLFKKLEPLIAGRLGIKKDRSLTVDKVEQLLIDASEQEIRRPQNKKSAKRHTQGKKRNIL